MTSRRKLFLNVALIALALIVLAMPAAQDVLAFALDEFAAITERAWHFPCKLLDRGKYLPLDKFDPICPQCL